MVLSDRDITTYGTTIRIFLLAVVCIVIVSLAPYGNEVFAGENPTAYFYIEIHTEAIIRNKAEFDIETRLLQRLADLLEKHGARGSFMILDIYPRMTRTYSPGTETMISILEKRGHEIGVHYHLWGPEPITIASTIRDIKSNGASDVESLTTSFHRWPVLDVEKAVFDINKQESRLESMLGDIYAGGITSAFRWCMEDSTPYTPRRDNWITAGLTDCWREREIPDPGGKIVAVGMYDAAGYTFAERKDGFTEMLDRVRRVLPGFKRGVINYFPMAIHDYFFLNPSGEPTVNRIVSMNEERLAQFDRFLDEMDLLVKKGQFLYGTRKDVTQAFTGRKTSQGKMEKHAHRINLFYLVHVHSDAAYRPEFVPLSKEDFEGTLRTVEAIAKTLESHNARGSFHIMQNFADAAVGFQGRGSNILKDLADRGHEIGAHVHTDRYDQWQKTRDAILATGVNAVPTFSGLKAASIPVSEAFQRLANLDFRIATGNNSPLDPSPIDGMKGASFWGFIGNERYRKTGAFIHPWLPDYRGNAVAMHDPEGKVLYLDTVEPTLWISGRGAIRSSDFDRLKNLIDGAVGDPDSEPMNTWGFVTHETEFQIENGNYKPTNSASPESLKALGDFLSYTDRYGDVIQWSTPREIYTKFTSGEGRTK